jgi:hypothetical protein
VQDKKNTMTWTNIEENVYNMLGNTETLMEVCVLTLYGQNAMLICRRFGVWVPMYWNLQPSTDL